ncbi:MAG: Long-chain-fatty-acid--CoA ligase [Firmicutes bacterium ADurb.Bin456]|nr:MAG: Long-chain-fatty-acid--CoA ligase [Firmicutes bacterium ADurb.Bin456]
MLVNQLIFQGAAAKVALREKGTVYSYGQFQNRTGVFRDYLYARGVRERNNVALFAKNSADFIFSYMAVVSLGAVVVPLNPMLTPREIAFILKDCGAKHIITDKKLNLAGQYQDGQEPEPEQLSTTRIGQEVQPAYPAAPEIHIQETAPCVILYTSGTTGRPKGALLTHRNLVRNARSFSVATGACADDNFLCVLPMFHSFGWTCSVLTALYNGASLTILESFQPKEVIATIRNQGVTVVMGVPAMYGFYASLATPEDLAGVRLFASGGASLPLEILNSFYEKTGKRVIEGYGLSEASPVVCFNPRHATKPGSVGLAVIDVEVKVVKDDGSEASCREVGELIIRGPNIMLGYYGLPVESAEALKDGWLYTGDLAYLDEEGYIFIVDRKKDIIIVSGLNVYPREVEEILYQYPAVKEAAVVGKPDKKRGETVRAFVVVKEGLKLNKKDLIVFLKANLASYKMPREIMEIDALPKNATGKILKKELRGTQTR